MSDDKSLERELAGTLRASEDSLDSDTLSRLRAARRQSLDAPVVEPTGAGTFNRRGGWLLAASVAAIAVLVSISDRAPVKPPLQPQSRPGVVLEEGPFNDMDLYENLEFYEWLAAQQQEDMG